MIVARIMGGLGNQMFQYAFGLYLAERHRTELWLDSSSYAGDKLRSYTLDRWRITATEAPAAVRALIPRQRKWYRDWFGSRRSLKRIAERPFGFQRRYLATPNASYLDGYWQSEQFLPGMKARLQTEFQPARSVSAATQAVARKIDGCEAVSLHVRRTDYLQLSYAGPCPVEYYRRSVADLLARHAGLHLFIFSDDMAWCREQLQFPCSMTLVDHNDAATAHEDIWLMSRCRHHVIANSTFSWWGAWLREDETGDVYAPRVWFTDPTMDASAVVPKSWRRLPDDPANAKVA
jgi:hypothetical protein